MRKLILYISCSLDGYIAKPKDDLSFLSIVQKEGEDYGYNNFVATVDTVIVGRKTYDWVVGQGYDFPHSDKESYIITRQERPKQGNLTFYNGDLKTLVKELKAKKGKNIFCDGGSEIVNQLLADKLFDEMILSVVPILVGDGTRLFQDGRPEQELELASTKNYDSGLVQMHYKMKDK
ncbi:dihydrofolate reductase family protein [Pontibacter cellulosilyticus]|uniref:Dihydrofolate reductase n=1 Tax=Pontibacter cellulosilyticus TaxID=1720253 RepID=A0A923N3W6_9BACT|nr:dihydrofolate reductase family protein [Pontibacter cellulosilyticus]MBC5991773.1 dihydrofolate reductase [Pontibacter cellulosilyticus]